MQEFALFFQQKAQTVILFGKLFKQDTFRFARGFLHIVDEKLLKVTGDDPARPLRIGQCGRISLCLLKRRKERSIRLTDGTAQIDFPLFLFNQHVRGRDVPVNETGMIELYALLKMDKLFGFGDAEHFTQEGKPKGLGIALFIATRFPIVRKGFCRPFLFCFRHHAHAHVRSPPRIFWRNHTKITLAKKPFCLLSERKSARAFAFLKRPLPARFPTSSEAPFPTPRASALKHGRSCPQKPPTSQSRIAHLAGARWAIVKTVFGRRGFHFPRNRRARRHRRASRHFLPATAPC